MPDPLILRQDILNVLIPLSKISIRDVQNGGIFNGGQEIIDRLFLGLTIQLAGDSSVF